MLRMLWAWMERSLSCAIARSLLRMQLYVSPFECAVVVDGEGTIMCHLCRATHLMLFDTFLIVRNGVCLVG